MTIPAEQLEGWITGFLWPFVRIAALVMAAPVLGTRVVPMRLRAGLALAVTLVVMPVLPPPPPVDPVSAEGVLIIVSQVLVGLAMGFMIRMVFSAIETGGHVIGQTMGLGFAQMMDPANGIAVPMVSQFYSVIVTLVFLVLNGHLILIEVLAGSFQAIPVAPHGIAQAGLWTMLSWAAWIFKGAVLVALPVVVALLLVNVAFGVMMRAAPQLNIFAVGFPISLTLGFVFMFVSLPAVIPQFSRLLEGAFTALHAIMGG